MTKKEILSAGFKLPPKPPRADVPEPKAEAFVAPEQSPVAVPREPSPKPAASSRLRRDERGERVSFYLPPELAKAVRVRCAQDRRSVSDGLTAAVLLWLSERGPTET